MAEENIISRIYEGHESKEKVQYIKCAERNPGLISQKEQKRIAYGYGFAGCQVKLKIQEGKNFMGAYKGAYKRIP